MHGELGLSGEYRCECTVKYTHARLLNDLVNCVSRVCGVCEAFLCVRLSARTPIFVLDITHSRTSEYKYSILYYVEYYKIYSSFTATHEPLCACASSARCFAVCKLLDL